MEAWDINESSCLLFLEHGIAKDKTENSVLGLRI